MRDFLDELNFFKGLKLAAVSTAMTAPWLAYAYFVQYRSSLDSVSNIPGMAARDLALVGVALLISSTAGFAWARGKGGIGLRLDRLAVDWKWIVGAGLALCIISGMVFDKWMYGAWLAGMPRNPFEPMRYAFFEEVICRFGIFAIVLRLSKSLTLSIAVSALFNTALSVKGFMFAGCDPLPWQVLTGMLFMKLGFSLFYGWFYCKKGLASTMLLHFTVGLKQTWFVMLG